ncbi:hypothetical protein [Methyloversatilis sp. XJ19-13]|uniref:hypothetical protein n=1 Tax=Methyloversatilis sp. XJ19-13 TaxID=2963430 RepID=UPI00211C4034|nr:hypothetical protein [Methyloversatilis sp. XJ19-13]
MMAAIAAAMSALAIGMPGLSMKKATSAAAGQTAVLSGCRFGNRCNENCQTMPARPKDDGDWMKATAAMTVSDLAIEAGVGCLASSTS